MTKGSRPVFGLFIAVLVIAALGLAASTTHSGNAAQSQSEVDLVAVDTGISGNEATSFASIDGCAEVSAGTNHSIDIVIDEVPLDRPMVAFQFTLTYDPEILTVVGVSDDLLLRAAGEWQPIRVISEVVPDTDGFFTPAVADFSDNFETGPGVLARVTLSANKDGLSTIGLLEAIIVDPQSDEVPVRELRPAFLAVGVDCPSEPPLSVFLTPGAPPPYIPPPNLGLPPDEDTDGTPLSETPTGDDGDGDPTGTAEPQASAEAGTPQAAGGDSSPATDSGDDDSGGVPAWIAAPIVAGILAAAGGFWLYRRLRNRTT